MPAQEIFIIRHGQTDYNKKRIIQGRGINSVLNEEGRKQADAFFSQYAQNNFDGIYASALTRTYQTVAPFKEMGYTIPQFAELDEISWGKHEGKKPNESMNKTYHQMNSYWKQGNFDYKIPDGESPLEVQQRLQSFLSYLEEQEQEQVLLCTHGRTARILLCTLLGDSLTNMHNYSHNNTGLSKVVWTGEKYELVVLNDQSHLNN